MDGPGSKADEKLAWLRNSQRLNIPQLQPRDGYDLTDFHQQGGHLGSLIENALDPETLIRVTWPADTKPATVPDQYWRNADQSIEAFYTPEQLEECLGIMHAPTDEILT